MRRRRLAPLGAALCVFVVGTAVSPVQATVVHEGSFEGTDEFSYLDCGYPIDVSQEFKVTTSYRVGKNKDASAFFFRESVSFREVHTNRLTGEWFVAEGHSSLREIKATRVE